MAGGYHTNQRLLLDSNERPAPPLTSPYKKGSRVEIYIISCFGVKVWDPIARCYGSKWTLASWVLVFNGNYSFPLMRSSQASVRPTNLFAPSEVPTTPKKRRTIYSDRDCIAFVDNLLIFADSFRIGRVLIYKQVSVFSKVQMPLLQNPEENTVPEKLTLKEVTLSLYCI